MSLNQLRNMANENEPAIGTFLSCGNLALMECLGYTGLDFVIIDTEHGPFDTETMMNLIRVAELVGLVPIVRIANVDHREIQRAADCGAQGLIIPCLKDVADFYKAVDLAKYTPIGNRGFIKGRGTGYGNQAWANTATLEEYFANSNDRLMLIPQCETVEALQNIEEIAMIEGIDGVFIGPFDLSTAMGIPGQFHNPSYAAATDRILKACQNAHKPCYLYTGSPDETADYLNQGFAGAAYSIDFSVFTEAYQKIVEEIEDRLQDSTQM